MKTSVKYRVIYRHKEKYPISEKCRFFSVSRSGYYDYVKRMKDQAKGKAYSYDDGGSYYCMGKNDTCRNKTNNKYDLYCNSCDPDGDNIEG